MPAGVLKGKPARADAQEIQQNEAHLVDCSHHSHNWLPMRAHLADHSTDLRTFLPL